MTLHSLNQAVHNINKFTEEHHGQCYSTLMILVMYKMFDKFPFCNHFETDDVLMCHRKSLMLKLETCYYKFIIMWAESHI